MKIFNAVFFIIVLITSSIQCMEEAGEKVLPKLPKELWNHIIVDFNNESFIDVLKIVFTISQVNKDFYQLAHSDDLIGKLRERCNSDDTSIALIVGSYAKEEVKRKKSVLQQCKDDPSKIDNYIDEVINSFNNYGAYPDLHHLNNLKYSIAGILLLLKWQLPFDRSIAFKANIRSHNPATVAFLLAERNRLQIPYNLDPYNPDPLKNDLNNLLKRSVNNCDYPITEMLIKAGADVTKPLYNYQNNNVIGKFLLQVYRHESSKSYLQFPISRKILKQMLRLIATPATLNYQNEEGKTPLMIAAGLGNKKAVQLFLKKGADTSLRDYDEQTIMDLVKEPNYTDPTIKNLIEQYVTEKSY